MNRDIFNEYLEIYGNVELAKSQYGNTFTIVNVYGNIGFHMIFEAYWYGKYQESINHRRSKNC